MHPLAASWSTCSAVSIPREQAMLISTSLRIASMPAATWAINRSSGPAHRGHDAELGGAGLGGLFGRLDQAGYVQPGAAHREANSPDCEQKWQSSGQPPVFRLMMPSTSTSGPHQRIRTSWASANSSSSRSSGSCSTASTWSWFRPSPRCSTCWRATTRMSELFPPSWPASFVGRVAACVTRYSLHPSSSPHARNHPPPARRPE